MYNTARLFVTPIFITSAESFLAHANFIVLLKIDIK